MFNENANESNIGCSEACSVLFRSIRNSNSLDEVKWLLASSIPDKIITNIKKLEDSYLSNLAHAIASE